MSWNGPDATPATVRIASVYPRLNSSEQRVADLLASDPGLVVDCTAQEIAARAGVARSTVVRTSQSLGYAGYPQLRVALAQELSPASSEEFGDGELGRLRSAIGRTAASLPAISSMLTDADLEAALVATAEAHRVMVVGNGLSGPLAAETALRLTFAGRPAEYVSDGLGQRVSAAQLGASDVCLVLSASGTEPDTVATARSARSAGARVIALTSFAGSPVGAVAGLVLIVPQAAGSLRSQQEQSSRLPHALVLEAFVDGVARRREVPTVDRMRAARRA